MSTLATPAVDTDTSPRITPDLAGGWRGWAGPLAVGALAAVLRLWDLGRPHAMVFDETYYAKDALSLLLYGHERQAVKKANEKLLNSTGDLDAIDIFKDDPSYVVHPPFGKWVIASGEYLFGATPFGWRFAVAIVGILTVILLARVVRRLTRSNLLGTIAGGLMAIDGVAIAMSRTALLDGILAFLVLAAFGCLLLDRERTRRILPAHSLRPWRWSAAVFLGLACSVKWSGLWFLAAFGLLTVFWDISARRERGDPRPWLNAGLRDALPAFLVMVPTAALVYLLTWYGWFTTGGYFRNWAADENGATGIMAVVQSLWHYHAQAMSFHTGLTTAHSYEANPWTWPLQTRPTSFFYESDGVECAAAGCSQEVIALGNPVIWWAGSIALVHQLWRWLTSRDWRAGAILCGFLAGWAPWLFFQERTVFAFYSIVLLPFLVMALTRSLGSVMGSPQDSEQRRLNGTVAAYTFLLAAVVAAWWFYPIWSGEPITYREWQLRMWLRTWV